MIIFCDARQPLGQRGIFRFCEIRDRRFFTVGINSARVFQKCDPIFRVAAARFIDAAGAAAIALRAMAGGAMSAKERF